MKIDLTDFSAVYSLNSVERNELISILTNTKQNKTGYEASLFMLFKEFNFDTEKLVRLLLVDSVNNKSIFVHNLLWKFTTLIKEAVVLVAVKSAVANNQHPSIVSFTKTQRFRALKIDRNFIHRTIKKYNIKYTKRKYQSTK